jgi:hypothetical protein
MSQTCTLLALERYMATILIYHQPVASLKAKLQWLVVNIFLNMNTMDNNTTTLLANNKGVQNECNNIKTNTQKSHRSCKIYLILEPHNATNNITRTSKWVGGHHDMKKQWETIDDLISLQLGQQAMLNIWFDKMAADA